MHIIKITGAQGEGRSAYFAARKQRNCLIHLEDYDV